MADIAVHKIYILCPVCWGKGTTEQTDPVNEEVDTITCPNCGGKKFIFGGWMREGTATITDPEVPAP